MSSGQKTALTTQWPKYGLTIQNHPINFKEIFNNDAPIVLEIGFGNGDTLISLATQHPGVNFIGIDVHKPGVGGLLVKLEKHQLENVRVFCADAIAVLHQCISNESLQAIYLLFPDPWPKRRHHKRRIVQPAFIELVEKKLIPTGQLHLATDWEDYAHHMHEMVSQHPGFQRCTTVPAAWQRPSTKFEARGKKLGYGVWDFTFEKIQTR